MADEEWQKRLNDTGYKNWLKVSLALIESKEALHDFVEDVIKIVHNRIKTTLGSGVCTKTSACNTNGGRAPSCPSCDQWVKEIKAISGGMLNWKNTDPHNWHNKPWEIAKCFMNPQGSKATAAANTGPDKTDLSGILNVLVNCKEFKSHLKENKLPVQVRTARNELMHSATMSFNVSEMQKKIDTIIALLEDEKELKNLPICQEKVKLIKSLRDSEFQLKPEDEDLCIDTALKSPELSIEAGEEIDVGTRLFLDKLLELIKENKDLVKKFDTKIDKIDKKLNKLKEETDVRFSRCEVNVGNLRGTVESLVPRLEKLESSPSHSLIAQHEKSLFKNALQSYTQKKKLERPKYDYTRVGDMFLGMVSVQGQKFESKEPKATKKEAEQSAAEVALRFLGHKDSEDDDVLSNSPSTVAKSAQQQRKSFKNLLQEKAQLYKIPYPIYDVEQVESGFVCKVMYDGRWYSPEITPQSRKIDAQQKTAEFVLAVLDREISIEQQFGLLRSFRQLLIAFILFLSRFFVEPNFANKETSDTESGESCADKPPEPSRSSSTVERPDGKTYKSLLNEYAQKMPGTPPPKYEDIPVTDENGRGFRSKVTVLGMIFECFETYPSKKRSREMAAKEAMKYFCRLSTQSLPVSQEEQVGAEIVESNVIEMAGSPSNTSIKSTDLTTRQDSVPSTFSVKEAETSARETFKEFTARLTEQQYDLSTPFGMFPESIHLILVHGVRKEWKRLAIELGISTSNVDTTLYNEEETTSQVLESWIQRDGKYATLDKILKVLKNLKEDALAKEIVETLNSMESKKMQGTGSILSQGKERKNKQDEQNSWFEHTFLDSKFKLKKKIHEELRSFSWLHGAYGLIGPTKKIHGPHLYLTVKRGVKKLHVRRELQDKFKCDDAKQYFELVKEPKKKPKVKYLVEPKGGSNSESKASVKPILGGSELTATTCKPAPGGGVFATIGNNSKSVGLDEGGKGTLTMFCYSGEHHYALTCFHVGCATDENCFNTTFHKIENILEIRRSLSHYENYANEHQYYFIEDLSERDHNEAIPFENNGSPKRKLGTFKKYHFDEACDILGVEVADDVEVECKVAGVTSRDWDAIWKALYQIVLQSTVKEPVKVEKVGFSSGLTEGHIIAYDFNYCIGKESLYKDAIIVKGSPGPFLKSGDSGSLVFFRDSENQKQAFAYGVCEVGELTLPKHIAIPLDDDGSDTSSIWSGEEDSEGSGECESEDEYVSAEEQPGDDELGDEDGTVGQEDDGVDFQEEGGTNMVTYFGENYICLRLDTALEQLKLKESACLKYCGSKNSENEDKSNYEHGEKHKEEREDADCGNETDWQEEGRNQIKSQSKEGHRVGVPCEEDAECNILSEKKTNSYPNESTEIDELDVKDDTKEEDDIEMASQEEGETRVLNSSDPGSICLHE